MDLSFREKSLIGSLVVTAAVLTGYVWRLSDLEWQGLGPQDVGLLLIGLIIAIIIIESVYHAILAGFEGDVPNDERDRLIAALGQRNAYYVLFGTLATAIAHTLLNDASGVLLVHHAVLALLLAETANFASQLYYQRAGV